VDVFFSVLQPFNDPQKKSERRPHKMESKNSQVNRRTFLKLGLAGAAATAIGSTGITELAASSSLLSPPSAQPVYRILGRTGLKVTALSFGAMLTPEHEVIRAGLDMGINFVDTARVYLGGRSEEIVGKALKGIRDKVFVATKTRPASNTKEAIIKDVEMSLANLQIDHIDVIQLHNLDSPQRALIPEVREAYTRLREQGKVRFFGITTHTNQAAVINGLADDPEKFFDTIQVAYNFKSDPAVKEAIARASAAGLGIIAMKIQMGGYKTREEAKALTPEQAAANLKWVLQDKNVSNAIPGMRTLEQVKQMVSVMGTKLTKADERILLSYARAIDPYYCRHCGQCQGTCPQGVAISTINRALMYHEGYHVPELARETYRELPTQALASNCLSCSTCVARCVRGLDIGRKMAQARATFA
jgi:predicted aldo/keto reductase-like oxidoreductase